MNKIKRVTLFMFMSFGSMLLFPTNASSSPFDCYSGSERIVCELGGGDFACQEHGSSTIYPC